ncbi:VOC family protein [Acinetobacter tibetensis]|uniref:VOC family protein n=1 Tax=Acinetobacter tibetensis TaxID=2943497 RepID=A0AAE9LS58_9GAMM|nr:VOC family protein [Acinetobacter tibetensis]USE83591.1 VOC family protein [Acinetobacter tibetensis]
MHAHLSVLTLAVHDLQASLNFYCQGLGFESEGIIGQEFENGAVAFIELQSGLKLALWPQQSLSADTGLALTPICPTGFSLGHNVGSAAEVDAIMTQAAQAGATITKAAQATFYGGYAGYFQDPNGHLWEIVWNPCWENS